MYLYVNAQGQEVKTHSYSGGLDFKLCKRLYQLSRIQGWKQKEQWAGGVFGSALEKAVQFYHESEFKLKETLEFFNKEWAPARDLTLTYSAVEKDWYSLNLTGLELLTLYSIKLPKLPISLDSKPIFQYHAKREVLPNSKYAGIAFSAYIDMIASTKDQKQILIDLKALGRPIEGDLIGLDPQLRRYSWITENENVGFLGFIKTNRGLEKGSFVTFLGQNSLFEPGDTAIIIKCQEYEPPKEADPAKPRSKPKEEVPEETWVVRDYQTIEEMNESCGTGQTKQEKEARDSFIRERATAVDRKVLTKQRIQFLTGTVNTLDREEVARQVRREVMEIVYSYQSNEFPKEGGIRWPHDDCVRCHMRGVCNNDAKLRDQLVERKENINWEEMERAA